MMRDSICCEKRRHLVWDC